MEAEIKAQGGDCLSVAGDVGADDFPKKIVDATVQWVSHTHSSETTSFFFMLYRKWGKINHIVNNAGFTFDKMFHTMPDDTFDIILKIHVRAPFRLIRQAAPYFRLKVILLSPLCSRSRSSCCMNLAWTTWKSLSYQRIIYFGSAWKRGPSQLCRWQGCCSRIDQDHCEGMGPFWCSCQHRCIWLNPYPVRSTFPTFISN